MEGNLIVKFSVEYTKDVIKDLKKLDNYTKQMIKIWIEKHLAGCENPRAFGKALKGNLQGRWRYRIGDYRLLCKIEDEKMVIVAITVGHRKEIYKG